MQNLLPTPKIRDVEESPSGLQDVGVQGPFADPQQTEEHSQHTTSTSRISPSGNTSQGKEGETAAETHPETMGGAIRLKTNLPSEVLQAHMELVFSWERSTLHCGILRRHTIGSLGRRPLKFWLLQDGHAGVGPETPESISALPPMTTNVAGGSGRALMAELEVRILNGIETRW